MLKKDSQFSWLLRYFLLNDLRDTYNDVYEKYLMTYITRIFVWFKGIFTIEEMGEIKA